MIINQLTINILQVSVNREVFWTMSNIYDDFIAKICGRGLH